MPIISSVPALNSITKGTSATFTLSKAQLLLIPSVAGSAYYSNSANWKTVILNYRSSTLNQPERVRFDAQLATPTAVFQVAASALDIFQINTISIVDFQGGIFKVQRSELTVAEFDVDMSPATLYARDFAAPNTLQAYESAAGGSSVGSNILNLVQGSEYANSASSFVFTEGASYIFRVHVSSYSGIAGTLDVKIGGVYITSFTHSAILAAIAGYADVTFTPNAAQVIAAEKFKLEGGLLGPLSVSKIEIVNN